MINYDVCNQMLIVHVVFVIIIYIAIILLIGLILFLLKLCKILSKKLSRHSFFVLAIGCFVILLFYIIPPTVDIMQKNYVIKEDIVLCKEEKSSSRFISQNSQIIFKNRKGEEIELFDFMIDKNDLIKKDLDGYIIYSKYSKICIAYFDYEH